MYRNLLIKWNIEHIITSGKVIAHEDKNSPQSEENNSENNKETIQQESKKEEHREEIVKNVVVDEFSNIYKNWIFITMSFFTSIIKTKTVDKDKVSSFVIEIKNAIDKEKNKFLKIIGHEFEGIPYIYRKTLETITLSTLISKNMNHNAYSSNNVMFATLFHDIGMVTVPVSIVNKREALTEEEATILKNHTVQGFKYLQAVGYSPLIASGALQHHERLDGKGYPHQVKGDKISEVAKIIAVVDTYCASVSQKPFKPIPIHAKAAIQELLKGAGTQYDADIITHLIKNVSFYPIGSTVILSDERIASVFDTSGVPMRPIVKIDETNEELDLSKNQNIFIKGIYVKKT
jgi:HD-GYP domain-containing protein (c-di-GMP phosphodiesterase class II)